MGWLILVKRIGSFRRKTRHKLGKTVRKKGKISLSKYFQVFKIGQKVQLMAESSVKKGMYRPRFYGKSGTVKGKTGNCYKILIKDKNKEKLLTIHPIHLKKIWGQNGKTYKRSEYGLSF